MEPDQFLEDYGHLETASLLYEGKAAADFYGKVENGELGGMTYEGVVCKARSRENHPLMFKYKSQEWLEEVKKL